MNTNVDKIKSFHCTNMRTKHMRDVESLGNEDNTKGQIKIKNPSYRAVNELFELLLQSVSSERKRKKNNSY